MRKTLVVGPAYVDVVLRVEGSLLNTGVIDGSFEGSLQGPSDSWWIEDEAGTTLLIHDSSSSTRKPIPPGKIRLRGRLPNPSSPHPRERSGRLDGSHLGGMGAGYARALGGDLVSAIGTLHKEPDPMGSFVVRALAEEGIGHHPIFVVDRATDWTLLVTSGEHGDKLAIGFRGCHSSLVGFDRQRLPAEVELLVVAGFSNRVVKEVLSMSARVRMLAPAMRNMIDADTPLAGLAGRFDVLCCNRAEWEALSDREALGKSTPLVAVTDGPSGCRIDYLSNSGERARHVEPAFPRDLPPRDTNRAGEAFASTLVRTLLDEGWTSGPLDSFLIHYAARRASAAAALVLDRLDFGFPSEPQIDQALRDGRVRPGDPGDGG